MPNEPPSHRDAKSLVSSLLAATPAPTTPAAAEAEPGAAPDPATAVSPVPAPSDPEAEARELIDLYFELEEPAERDVVLDRLTAIPAPLVTDFLRTMMDEDEDEFMRAAAACELARRGVAEAMALLEEDLANPDEIFFFTNAIEGLAACRGPAFYDTLRDLWADPTRDSDERREAMKGMEQVDAPRALADFVALVDGQRDFQQFADDQVETAILLFARHQYEPGRQALLALRERLANAADLAAEDRDELTALVQEGLGLFGD